MMVKITGKRGNPRERNRAVELGPECKKMGVTA
jgi:hypothetical protein